MAKFKTVNVDAETKDLIEICVFHEKLHREKINRGQLIKELITQYYEKRKNHYGTVPNRERRQS